jgi:thioredoxin 1
MTIQLTSTTFDEFVQASDVPVLVDFWAEWCGPCKMMTKTVDALSDESDGLYSVVKVNVDENPELARRFGIQGIPAFKVFSEGQVVGQTQGAQGKGALKDLVRQAL